MGREVVRQLRAEWHQVRLLVRDLNSPSVAKIPLRTNIELHQGSVLDPIPLTPAMKGVDAVIHLVGIIGEMGEQTFENVHARGAENIVRAALITGVRRVIHMSALGTRPNAVSRYHRSKWSAEQSISQSTLAWTIFRPSLIYGPEDDFVNRFARMAKSSPVLPVLGEGKALFQPVSVHDVGRCFVAALTEPRAVRETFDLCGPDRLTFPEILRAIQIATGKRKRIVHVPVNLARLMARFLEFYYPRFLKKTPPLNQDQVQMLQESNTGDPKWATEVFNLHPKTFPDGIAEYLGRRFE